MNGSAKRWATLASIVLLVAVPDASATAKGAAPKVLLQAKGSGPKVTPKFIVTAKEWDLAWSYKCTGPGNFIVSVTGGKTALAPVNKTGTKGSGTAHYTSGGTFSLTVFTGVCTWTLKATS